MSRITVKDAARQLDVNPQFLRMALQDRRLDFGAAVRGKGGRWSYYISEARFKEYIKKGGWNLRKYRKEKAFECRARIDKGMNDFLQETAYLDQTNVSEVIRSAIHIYRELREAIDDKNPHVHGGTQGLSTKEKKFFREHFSTNLPESQKKHTS